jgi:hypothetical protein
MALQLKRLSHLGYAPDPMPRIPAEVRSFVAGQLGLQWDPSEAYSWDGTSLRSPGRKSLSISSKCFTVLAMPNSRDSPALVGPYRSVPCATPSSAARKGGELEQIQFLRGHESILTTERCRGLEQDLKNVINDALVFE